MGSYIFWIVILAILFVLVYFNNKRNMTKLRDRRNRKFGDNYFDKKNEKK